MTEELHSNAFVLRTRNYGESDRIVVLLTEEAGKISAIAKGARRSVRRFAGGALEPFQELAVRLDRKSMYSLAFLHESRVVHSNRALASNLDAFAWAAYLTELTEVMTVDRDPCPDLYNLYREVMSGLGRVERPGLGRMERPGLGGMETDGAGRVEETGPGHDAGAGLGRDLTEPLAHHFVLGLLDRSGWAPDFGVCGVCSEPVTELSRPILDSRGSGVICARHEAEAAGFEGRDEEFRPSRRIIDPALMAYVRDASTQVPATAEPETGRLATALLERLVDLHLSKPLRSRAFLRTIAKEFQ